MIEITNLKKTFNGNVVINNLNLKVEKGERIAVIGPSGCGKSTLLRLLMGLQKPDHGTIIVNGKSITRLDISKLLQIRQKFGMLFQSAALFDSMSVEENVSFSLVENLKLSPKKTATLVAQKLEMVDMSGTEKLMPSGLSGGMKKRIGLARAIATEPEIMLYDEPTTGLDPILSTNIENLIVKLATKLGVTSIVVTHQISTILRTTDKIYVMYEGKLLPPETPDTIMNSKNEYIRFFIRGGDIK